MNSQRLPPLQIQQWFCLPCFSGLIKKPFLDPTSMFKGCQMLPKSQQPHLPLLLAFFPESLPRFFMKKPRKSSISGVRSSTGDSGRAAGKDPHRPLLSTLRVRPPVLLTLLSGARAPRRWLTLGDRAGPLRGGFFPEEQPLSVQIASLPFLRILINKTFPSL